MPVRRSDAEADATIAILDVGSRSGLLFSPLCRCGSSCEGRGRGFDKDGGDVESVPALEGFWSVSRFAAKACVNKDAGFFAAVCEGVHFAGLLCELP
jgi:hypothetical protein